MSSAFETLGSNDIEQASVFMCLEVLGSKRIEKQCFLFHGFVNKAVVFIALWSSVKATIFKNKMAAIAVCGPGKRAY